MTNTTPQYVPDPALVRECATRIIEGQIEELRDLGQMDIGEMCAEEIVAIQEPLGGWDAPGADEAADALINAVRADIKAAVITHAWPGSTPAATVEAPIVRLFTVAELEDYCLPCENVIYDEEIGERRKTITHRAVFLADDDCHYAVEWDEPKSEAQEGIKPFDRQGETVEAVRVEVRQRAVVVDEWLPVEAEGADR
jgi:hypothetical protein